MKTVTINQAQSHLSQLVDDVIAGEKVLISRDDLPLAILSPYIPTSMIKLGVWQGKAHIDDAVFDSTDQEINDLFTKSQLFPTN